MSGATLDYQVNSEATAARHRRAAGIVLLISASVLWSISGVVVKVVQIDPIAFAFWRSAGAAAGMLAIVPFSRGRLPRANAMLLSIILYTAVVSLLITAMTRSTAATGILLQYTGPVFCALFAWLFIGRKIGPRTLSALLIAVIGIIVMVLGGPYEPIVLIWGILSGVAFGGLILVLQQIESKGGINTFGIIFLNNLGCTILLLPFVWKMGVLGIPGWKLATVLATGVVQLAIPYILFQFGLRRVGPVEASLLILLEPVLNPVWVWLVVGERPDVATFIGGAAILTAMILEATKPPSRAQVE